MLKWFVLAVVMLSGRAVTPAWAATIDWQTCDPQATAGSAAAMDCGWLRTGDTLASKPVLLRIVVLRARPDHEDPNPIIYVPGGPGEAAGLDPASLRAWRAWQQRAGWRHDIALFDPRGTGESTPRPDCTIIGNSRREAAASATSGREFSAEARAAQHCYRQLGARQAAALGPATQLCDLVALIEALRVSKVNLWAVSYGTRIARLFAARHPDRVEAMVLDSLVPFERDELLALPAQIGSSIAALDDYCARHPACAAMGSTPGIMIHALLDRYGQNSPTLTVKRPAGRAQPFVVTPYRLLLMALFAGYDANNGADTIARLKQARAGDASALAPLADRLWHQATDDSRNEAVFWSTRCAFGNAVPTSRAWQHALSAYPAIADYLEPARASAICDFWQVPSVTLPPAGAALGAATLLVAGESDVVTPAAWTRRFMASHPAVRLLRLHDTGHAATFTSDCALRAAARFWDAPQYAVMPDCAGDE